MELEAYCQFIYCIQICSSCQLESLFSIIVIRQQNRLNVMSHTSPHFMLHFLLMTQTQEPSIPENQYLLPNQLFSHSYHHHTSFPISSYLPLLPDKDSPFSEQSTDKNSQRTTGFPLFLPQSILPTTTPLPPTTTNQSCPFPLSKSHTIIKTQKNKNGFPFLQCPGSSLPNTCYY